MRSTGSTVTNRLTSCFSSAAVSMEAADGPSDKEAESEEPQEKVKAQAAPKIEEEEQDLKVWIRAGVWCLPSCGGNGSRSWGPEEGIGASSPRGKQLCRIRPASL